MSEEKRRSVGDDEVEMKVKRKREPSLQIRPPLFISSNTAAASKHHHNRKRLVQFPAKETRFGTRLMHKSVRGLLYQGQESNENATERGCGLAQSET